MFGGAYGSSDMLLLLASSVHAAIFLILLCAGCNIKNIAVCTELASVNIINTADSALCLTAFASIVQRENNGLEV